MVVLAASIVSKQNGKILLSRQFVEMTRSRIEGLLTAFSKLIIKDKQHTFIETDTVRYVYQALMDKLYVVLITTKTSNILEDLETLRLFARAINEYTTQSKYSSDEQAVLDNAFTLIFAFDEIVSLGYRENVNMSQIRTFIEMDSHDERIYEAVRKTQERDAKNKMREKAKELSKLQRTAAIDKIRGTSSAMSGIGSSGKSFGSSGNDSTSGNYGGFGNNMSSGNSSVSTPPSKPKGPSKALKLGSKNTNLFGPPPEEQLVQELKQESRSIAQASAFEREPVHINIKENLSIEISKEGAVRSSELTGVIMICVQDEDFGRVKLQVDCEDEDVQIQSHPNVDKELFRSQGLVTLGSKSFPINSSVVVLKYRRTGTSGEQWPPLVVNCWPNDKNCNVQITANKALTDLQISIPCPTQPTVSDCAEGDYSYRRGFLVWNLPVLTPESGSVAIDFDLPQSLQNEEYFPIDCKFSCEKNLAGLIIREVIDDQIDNVKWSFESQVSVDRYEIV